MKGLVFDNGDLQFRVDSVTKPRALARARARRALVAHTAHTSASA
jgi:hypothetical protein